MPTIDGKDQRLTLQVLNEHVDAREGRRLTIAQPLENTELVRRVTLTLLEDQAGDSAHEDHH